VSAAAALTVAAIQPALRVGEVDANLRRVEDLIRDAHREHEPVLIVPPEALTSPNVFHPAVREVVRPVDGGVLRLATRLARELGTTFAGGSLARRGEDAFGTYVVAEPDGSAHLHDKDIPTAWEHHYYRGGDDDGRVGWAARGLELGLTSGWELARSRTAARLRGVDLVVAGMCWPSFPLNWTAPGLRWWVRREHRIWREQCRDLPGRVARIVGAPVVHASHVGPVTGRLPLVPRLTWCTEMLGETQIRDADGTVLARLTLEDGEGHVAARVAPGPVVPTEALPDDFWIPAMTASTRLAWHVLNLQGRIDYRQRRVRGRHRWQSGPATGDLADDLPPLPRPEDRHVAAVG
jgi:predicted amidohydrolase